MAITTSRALRGAIAAAIVALTVTACGISAPDPAACKAEIQAEYLKGKGHLGAEPSMCKGLPKAQVQQLTRQVLEGK